MLAFALLEEPDEANEGLAVAGDQESHEALGDVIVRAIQADLMEDMADVALLFDGFSARLLVCLGRLAAGHEHRGHVFRKPLVDPPRDGKVG